MKLSMEEKWLDIFSDTNYIDQKSHIRKLCEYVFDITVLEMWRNIVGQLLWANIGNVKRICS